MTQTTIITAPDDDQSRPASGKLNDAGRCIFCYPNHGRCRSQAQNPQTGLCLQHARAVEPQDTDDLTPELFGEVPTGQLPPLQTPEEVNDFLARVVVLLAEGRITPRRATVLTYASSLLLRAAIFIDKRPPEIIWDLDRPRIGDNPESRHVEERSPALTGANR
jgi:hypothetical protein